MPLKIWTLSIKDSSVQKTVTKAIMIGKTKTDTISHHYSISDTAKEVSAKTDPAITRPAIKNNTVSEHTNQMHYSHAHNPVKDLQTSVNTAFTPVKTSAQPTTGFKLSRAAHLHLINRLARFAPSAIFAIFAATLYLAVTHFLASPVKVGIWAFIVFCVGGKTLATALAYRAGDKKIASRPFHWRRCHIASLCVLSTAFGVGAILLLTFPNAPSSVENLGAVPIDTSVITNTDIATANIGFAMVMQNAIQNLFAQNIMTLGLLCGTVIFAAFTQIANPKGALAISLPTLAICAIGILLASLSMIIFIVSYIIISLIGLCLGVMAMRTYNRVAMRYPRTQISERDIHQQRANRYAKPLWGTAPKKASARYKKPAPHQTEPALYAQQA